MRKFTNWIVTKSIKNHRNIDDLKIRSQYGALEGWVSIIVNTLLFFIKIIVGLTINSMSLIADAVHTLADSATSVVIIIGFKMAKKPSDKEHPFGHGRIESVATLIVSVLLFIAGVELLEKSVHSIIKPKTATTSLGVILLIIAKVIREIIAEDKRVNSFHELRIVGCDRDKCKVVFDIALEEDADEQEIYDIIHSIQEKFKNKFPEMRTVIKAEPKYAYNL